MKRPIFHSAELQQEFIERGYVKVSLQQPHLLKQLALEIQGLQPNDEFDPTENKVNPLGSLELHCTFFDTNKTYKQKVQELLIQYFKSEIEHFLIDYAFMTGNVFQKPPNKGKMHLHQNWFLAEHPHTCLTFWIPLHDVDENNGALQVVEGSHKITDDIPTPFQQHYFTSFEQQLHDSHLTTIPLKLGEAVFFCESLIHGSPVNKTMTPRTAIQIGLYPAEVTPVLFFLNQNENQFEQYPLEASFFVDHSIEGALTPPQGKEKIKTIPNQNQLLSYEDFMVRMSEGPRVRMALYNRQDASVTTRATDLNVLPSSAPRKESSFLKKLFSFFKN